MAMVRIGKKHHEALDMERTKAVTDVNADPANAEVALRVLESLASAGRLAMCSVVEGHDRIQGELGKRCAKATNSVRGSTCRVFVPLSAHQ